ncbi:hypothetical protein QJS66_07775 [Kocuria rhizophila]|nr:hypothetical protein QJS66_07775 [Kocuria rhizophila]
MAKVLALVLVGMSTALEAIAARHAGLEILGMSLVTNAAAGISPRRCPRGGPGGGPAPPGPNISRLLADIAGRL